MESDVNLIAAHDCSRYELRVGDDLVGVADYIDRGDRRLFTHTEVDPRLGGRGLGARLVRFALEDTRRAGRQIVPICSFVAAVAAR
jgi:predicted GNAT family acetyltransferase